MVVQGGKTIAPAQVPPGPPNGWYSEGGGGAEHVL